MSHAGNPEAGFEKRPTLQLGVSLASGTQLHRHEASGVLLEINGNQWEMVNSMGNSMGNSWDNGFSMFF